MKRGTPNKNRLPQAQRAGAAAELPTGEAFRPEWIDFERGIRVGNLEPHERITRILKFHRPLGARRVLAVDLLAAPRQP